ncbi:MAG: prepilin-type N-terminal cleavage/methylation domain-containing protein [Planctomycetota bacterium]|nr:prepilin-type N-terminal cleavage/methylation domain-containing protein [Planctomycetota bacterium]
MLRRPVPPVYPAVSCGRRGRTGFTLIEVVVVIGIIGILLSLTFPAMRTLRLSALNTEDLSQIRQLGLAHRAYQQVHNDWFVDVGLPHGGYGDTARSFVEVLEPYLGTTIMQSPLDSSPFWEEGYIQDGAEEAPALRRTSYGMNNYLSRNYSPAVAINGPGAAADRITKIPFPDKTICFLHMTPEGSYAVSDHPHVESWAYGSSPWTLASSQVAISAAEGTRTVNELSESNYGFVDGSTGTRPFKHVYESLQTNAFDPDARFPITGG